MITTRDQLVNSLANNTSRIVLDKASIANQTAGRFCSLWRATGIPAQGAIPTTASICDNTTLGGVQFTQQVSPATSYLGLLSITSSNNAMSFEVHDRLAHRGGLVLNILTAQAVDLDLDLIGVSADRIGATNYSDTQCFLEVYTDGGATASNATINVTFDDDTDANLNVLAVGGTIRAGNCFNLGSLKTTGQQGKYIKRINTVTLSASTGTAGNFGFTFTRPRAFLPTLLANKSELFKWDDLGLTEVLNGSCLQLMTIPSTTSSGTLRGGGKIIHG